MQGRSALSGPITGNLVVPAGVTCFLTDATVSGHVSVLGELAPSGVTIVGNVNVNSGGAFYAYGSPSIIQGNMSITGSAGTVYHGANAFNTAGQSEVWGNFSYTGNSAPLFIGGSTHALLVKKNFNHSLNTGPNWIQDGALTVNGNSTIS